MDPTCGAHVFVSPQTRSAVLVLYRRLVARYLVLWYEHGRARYGLATFPQLLDALPVQTTRLPDMRFPLAPTMEETAHAWLRDAHHALCAALHAR